MGKKGSWLSAIKRVFTPSSKDKPLILNDSEAKQNKKTKTKKKKSKLRNGDTSSFIPLFREPSSIEKIFGDFEREQQRHEVPPTASSPRRPRSPKAPTPRPYSPKPSSSAAPPKPTSPRTHTPKAPAPRVTSPRAHPQKTSSRPQTPKAPTPRVTSPRAQPPKTSSFVTPRAQPSLRNQNASATRIQSAYRGYMGRKRVRAVKGLVRLQGVVGGQSVKRQTANAMKYMQLVVRVQSQIQSRRIHMLDSSPPPPLSSGAGNGSWDDSVLTKEEVDERSQKKTEAIAKRERAMAYAYSHQLWRVGDEREVQKGFPWWYNWLDRQIPNETAMETPTPRSSKSTMAFPSRMTPLRTPGRSQRSPFEFPARDSDSLTSCPAFSQRPNYMSPTASAKAKSRGSGSPREPATPTDSGRRLSFPFVNNRRGPPSSSSLLSPYNNVNANGKVKSRPKSVISVGNASVDSTLSMPATMGRKPFNRFV